MKFIKFFLLFIVLAILAISVGSYFWVKNYIKTPEFGQTIEKLANEKIDGDLVLENFSPKGVGFTSDSIELKESGGIESIKISGFETGLDLKGLLEKVWRLRTLECDKLSVSIRDEKKKSSNGKPKKGGDAKKVEKKKDVGSNDSESFAEGLLPKEVEFSKIRVGEFLGSVKTKKDLIKWDGVALNGAFKDNSLKLNIEGGNINIPLDLLPEWQLRKANVLVKEESYEVKNANFSRVSGGSAVIDGKGDFSGDHLEIKMDFKGLPVSSLVKKNKYAVLTGKVNGEVVVTNNGDDTITKGTINLSEGVISPPDSLNSLLKLIGQDFSGGIKVEKLEGDVTHIGDKTVVENLHLDAEQQFTVLGRIELNDEKYSMSCKFGIKEYLYKRLPEGMKKNFTEEDDYYFSPVNMAGNKDDFVKDITQKLLKESGKSLLGSSNLLDKAGDGILNLINKKSASDDADKSDTEEVIDKGIDALKGLFR